MQEPATIEALASRVKELEAELARAESFTRRLVAHLPIAMAYLDRDLVYRLNNPMHCEVLGVPAERILGHNVFEVLPDLRRQTEPVYHRVLEKAEEVAIEGFPLRTAEGRQTFWDLVYVPILDDAREVEGLIFLADEVTERMERDRLQQERLARLQELDRLKRDFLSAASHELRTPLTSIVGYAEFLQDGVGGTLAPEQVEFVREIQDGAARLRRIVDDLLDFAQLEAGTFRLSCRPADLGAVVRAAVRSLEPQAASSGLAIEIEVPADPVMLRMDPHRIEQVVLNLVGNALKFTPPGGRVAVKVQPDSTVARVLVEDTGIGIAPEHLQRVFEKFFQVDPSITRQQGGTGLGLAISRALVEAHGGTMQAESRPGSGSRFKVELPTTSRQSPSP